MTNTPALMGLAGITRSKRPAINPFHQERLMRTVTMPILAAILATASMAATTASAKILDVTGAGIYNTQQLSVNGANEYATALDLTVQGDPNPLWVYCVDLTHNIYVNIGGQLTYDPPLQYKTGSVTTNSNGTYSGTGPGISSTISAEIQTLAEIGVYAAEGNLAPAIAAAGVTNADTLDDVETEVQGAIWSVEYGYTSSQVVGTSTQNAGIAADIAFAATHHGTSYADAIYAVDGATQGFGTSQGFATGVPEPATWTMMIGGTGLLGWALRRRRVKASLNLSQAG